MNIDLNDYTKKHKYYKKIMSEVEKINMVRKSLISGG